MYLVVTRHNRTIYWSPTYRLFENEEDALKTARMHAAQYHNEMQVRLYKLSEASFMSWNELEVSSTTGDTHIGCGGIWEAADSQGLIDKCSRCGEERA